MNNFVPTRDDIELPPKERGMSHQSSRRRSWASNEDAFNTSNQAMVDCNNHNSAISSITGQKSFLTSFSCSGISMDFQDQEDFKDDTDPNGSTAYYCELNYHKAAASLENNKSSHSERSRSHSMDHREIEEDSRRSKQNRGLSHENSFEFEDESFYPANRGLVRGTSFASVMNHSADDMSHSASGSSSDWTQHTALRPRSNIEALISSEEHRIHKYRFLTFLFLIASGICGSVFTGWFVNRVLNSVHKDKEIFAEQRFREAVGLLQARANEDFQNITLTLQNISKALTLEATKRPIADVSSNPRLSNQSSSSFPFVTLSEFENMASDMILQNGIERVFWAPIVDASHKSEWENYTLHHQGWIVAGDDDHEESDIEDELAVVVSTHIHASLSHSPSHSGLHYRYDSFEYLPVWQTVDANYLQNETSYSYSSHGYSDHDHPETTSSTSHSNDSNQLICEASFVNLDVFSLISSEKGSFWFSRRNNQNREDVSIYSHGFTTDQNAPPSLVLQVPVFETPKSETVSAYLFALLDQESQLFASNDMQPFHLVVKDPESVRTYEIRGDLQSTEVEMFFLGNDDLHEPEYDDWFQRVFLGEKGHSTKSSTEFLLYPTSEYIDSLDQPPSSLSSDFQAFCSQPMLYAVLSSLIVAVVFGMILAALIFYDRAVNDRQQKLLRQAERTDAIVGSMFPANIQKKLMDIDTSIHDKSEAFEIEPHKPINIGDTHHPSAAKGHGTADIPKGSGRSINSRNGFRWQNTPTINKKNRKRIADGSNLDSSIPESSYVPGRLALPPPPPPLSPQNNDADDESTAENSLVPRDSSLPPPSSQPSPPSSPNSSGGLDALLSRYGRSKPMADFYPNTTIMMCDLAGFTAWSSARSPADVFRLLETIYGAFDDIARNASVFKVETVGDCYVACAGLPTRQPKHALIMARFAKKCLRRYETLIKKLEVYLGPDTVDLGLRMGIHSGPVTAGVLRGDKTRFQLFGDTVNTASRMESTGVVNKIQVSEQTADLLRAEGYGTWVMKRENLVTVKGKGEMQTYWLLRTPMSQKQRARHISRQQLKKRNSLQLPIKEALDLKGILEDDDESLLSAPPSMKKANSIHDCLGYDPSSGELSLGSSPLSSPVATRKKFAKRNSWTPDDDARNPRERRLIEWIVETLMQSLKKIAIDRNQGHRPRRGRRRSNRGPDSNTNHDNSDECSKDHPLILNDPDAAVIEEVQEAISIRQGDAKPIVTDLNSDGDFGLIDIPSSVEDQLRDYVTVISLLYHEHPFHNFEHCAHVFMSVSKLFARILECKSNDMSQSYGLTADPLIEFACLFSALIHDVDHAGVPNAQLVKENSATAGHYKGRSVAEQHSVAVAWSHLMESNYEELRSYIYETKEELQRFRQLVVNSVMATDIIDADLKKLREARWEKAFSIKQHNWEWKESTENANRMATVVIEHLIQASDISHTMQHWHVYLKFNERLFKETYKAFRDGRGEKDPSTYWYKGELGFFKFYIMPLATKLKECGVFGVSGDEYFMHAESNRSEWALKGEEIVRGYIERVDREDCQ